MGVRAERRVGVRRRRGRRESIWSFGVVSARREPRKDLFFSQKD